MKVLCGTGHRPQDAPDGFNHSWKNEISIIQKYIIDNGVTKVITGMALGFDQALAIAVIKLKQQGHNIVLEAACPCVGQEKKWNEEYQKLYSWILSKCDIVTHVSKTYTPTCMQDRNKYMVDNSNIVLAYYNGKGYGGTYNCIQYAKNVGKEVENIYIKEEKDMTFTKMYVTNNRELKKIHNNLVLNIRTRNTEDLLDISRQIWRLTEKEGYKVILQTPEGKRLPARALGTYTDYFVGIEIGGLNKKARTAKLTCFKSMMSHKEYVDIPMYEESFPSAFDYKARKEDEDGNSTQTVEKNVYLKRAYYFLINGKVCNNLPKIKKLAKNYKIPLAKTAGNKIIDERARDEDEYYMSIFDWFITEEGSIDYDENSKRLLIKKYRGISQGKKNVLLKYFGCNHSNDFVNFVYATQNFIFHVQEKLYAFDYRTDGANLYTGMLVLHGDEKKAYEEMVRLAKKGLCYNLTGFPELEQYKPDNYEWLRENPLYDDEEDTPLD